MRRQGVLLMIFIACCGFLAVLPGCWDRRELDELAIQLGTAIDKVGDNYRVAIQVVIPAEVSSRISSSGGSPVTMFQATAPTIFEAYRKMTETSSRKIYSAHIRVLVIGEEVAREGIAPVLDMFSRNHEPRTDFYLMVARNSPAMQILKTLTSLEKIPAEELFYALDTSARSWSPTTTVTIEALIEQLVTENLSPVLTGVEIVGNKRRGEQMTNIDEIDPGAKIRFVGLAVFRKDKLQGWLNERDSRGYNYIKDNVHSSAGSIPCPESEGKVVIETLRSKTRLGAEVENGEPVIRIAIKNTSTISEVSCKLKLNDPETFRQLERQVRGRYMQIMDDVIEKAKTEYKYDIFGFGNVLYKTHPKQWRQFKADWDERFRRLKVVYDIKVYIRRFGTTNDSFLNGIEE